MLKRFRFILSLLLTAACLPRTGTAQVNLVPNGDFELGPDSSSAGWIIGFPWDTTGGGCSPSAWVNGPDYWSVVEQTPDRMVETHMPICNWDNDTAYSGKAYCVFGSGNNNVTEAGKVALVSTLEKDSLYRLHYCVARQTFNGLNLDPERVAFIFNNGGDSIVSSLITLTQWQCYDTLFAANSNSTELTIRAVYPNGFFPALNIDNVSLEKVSTSGVGIVNAPEKKIRLFPNPAHDVLHITSTEEIRLGFICDIYGTVLSKNVSKCIDVSGFPKGVYTVVIETKKGYFRERILIQ